MTAKEKAENILQLVQNGADHYAVFLVLCNLVSILKEAFVIQFFFLKMLILTILGPDVSWTPKGGSLKGTF